MGNNISTEIVVNRRSREGWYYYTCEDLPGLFIASQNDAVAYNDVPKAIRALIKLDHGIDCIVTHKLPYVKFLENMKLSAKAFAELEKRTQELMDGNDESIPFMLRPAAQGVSRH